MAAVAELFTTVAVAAREAARRSRRPTPGRTRSTISTTTGRRARRAAATVSTCAFSE
jgi:hypothetical protein